MRNRYRIQGKTAGAQITQSLASTVEEVVRGSDDRVARRARAYLRTSSSAAYSVVSDLKTVAGKYRRASLVPAAAVTLAPTVYV